MNKLHTNWRTSYHFKYQNIIQLEEDINNHIEDMLMVHLKLSGHQKQKSEDLDGLITIGQGLVISLIIY